MVLGLSWRSPGAQGLMRISDYERRRVLQLINHFKSGHKQAASTGSRSFGSRAGQAHLATQPPAGVLDMRRAASLPQAGIHTPSSLKLPWWVGQHCLAWCFEASGV